MVDLDILRERGCSEDSLKKLFELDKDNRFSLTTSKDVGATGKAAKLDNLRDLIRSRIDEGRNSNIANYRIYQALDTAWDTPLKQISPTMIQSLIDSKMDSAALADALKSWGVDPAEILDEQRDAKTNQTIKRVNMPAFFRIFVPLIRSYVTIRRAKMMNDRRLVPFLKFEPAISNEETRMRCEVITSRVEQMSNDYGFWDVEDQACWRMLHYGICLRFPVEEWHREEQLAEADSPYDDEDESRESSEASPEMVTDALSAVEGEASTPTTTPAKNGGYKRVVMREGLRYHMPHPTRMFYDQAHSTHSFNSNTGCAYAGYWRVMRYGEILNKKKFYNLSTIAVGSAGTWFNNNKAFFDAVYPCTLRFPGNEDAGNGAGEFDQEKKIADGVYTTAEPDKGLIITELFMRLVPSEYALGDYDYPVWFRFVVANLDTIIYATPLPYSCPVIFDGYDPVSGRSLSPSMSLEILPFQDHFGNLLSQYLLSVKQNLTNMVMIDQDSVKEEEISALTKWTQKLWSGINFVRFSRRGFIKGQQVPEVTFPQRFPQVDTNSIAMAMKTVLEILERVLVMSAQELGQAASHEQTREEVRNIASNTSTRAEFTAGSLDRSKQAWKRQIYEGLMAYGCEYGFAQVPADPKITPEMVAELGFTWEGMDKGKKKLTVKYNKTAIRYETFTANRDVDDRINDRELAAQMGAFMQQLAANPITLQALGPDQFIAMANAVARAAGFPRDLVLHNRGPDTTPEENNQQLLQEVQKFMQEAMEGLRGEITKDVQGMMEQFDTVNNQQSESIEALANELTRLVQATGAAQDAMLPMPMQDTSPAMTAG